jgi:hypothetical protein
MPDILTPMRVIGAVDNGELLLYTETDFYGVEDAPAASTNDFSGFNEALAWTRRVYDAAIVEHYATGVHNTGKIARALLYIEYDAGSYVCGERSYCQSTAGAVKTGSSAATISIVGTGDVKIDLGYAMPSATYTVMDLSIGYMTRDFTTGALTYYYVSAWCYSITDSDTFNAKRRSGTEITTPFALTHGDMVLAVHGA